MPTHTTLGVMIATRRITDADYARLLSVRTQLRTFERWSAERAGEHGLTASQHQLLLAIRGHYESAGPTIGDVADYLLIKHNSAVELVDRAQELGFVTRHRAGDDQRVVRLSLTDAGQQTLEALSEAHLEELTRLIEMVKGILAES